jgi:hypothetical protein
MSASTWAAAEAAKTKLRHDTRTILKAGPPLFSVLFV